MKQGQSAVLAPKKSRFYPKVQSDPQLGGEGSGFPPRFYIATGQHNHVILGIDMGTHYMRVAALEGEDVASDTIILPADLGLHHGGQSSMRQQNRIGATGPGSVVQALRTKLGTNWCKHFAGQTIDAEELTTQLFSHILSIYSARFAKSIRDVVLTVPASYTSMERKLLKICAEDNGLSVIALINEPTAVAAAHHTMHPELPDGNYLIFHMGAGTCAATVYTLSNDILEIKATSADSTFGGRSFDDVIVQHFIEKFTQTYGRRPHIDRETLIRLEEAAASVKHDLLISNEAFYSVCKLRLSVPGSNYLQSQSPNNINLIGSLSRTKFEELCAPLLERAVAHAQVAIKNSHLRTTEIQTVFLCGGATLLPTLRNLLAELSPAAVVERLENDMLPAYGAIVQASVVTQAANELVIWDLLTTPINLIGADGSIIPLIAANTPLPVTAYARLDIIDNTINATLVQGEMTATDIVINNCPPCTNGENKVELAVKVSPDGTIQFGARHIGLDVALLVIPLQDGRRPYQGDLETLIDDGNELAGKVSGKRAQKLARTLNVPLYFLPQALRALGYTPEQIMQGEAIELALRHLRTERRASRRRKPLA